MVIRKEYDSHMISLLEAKLISFFSKDGIYVVGSIGESLLSRIDFFDTIYHPTEEASVRISSRLAEQIHPLLVTLSD